MAFSFMFLIHSTILLFIVSLPFHLTSTLDSRLILVQIIIRHAERAPINQFTSDASSKYFPRGLGQISDIGMENASEMGKSFRRRYRQLGLLNENTTKEEIFIRSSPVTRSLVSAVSFTKSFIGNSSNHSFPLIHTTQNELEEQVLFIIESPSFRCKVLAKHNISDSLCRSSLLKEKIVSSYAECTNFSYNMIEAAMAEMEQPGIRISGKLKNCVRKHGRKIAYKALGMVAGVGSELDIERARESIGQLLTVLTRNIDRAVNDTHKESIRIYYTHDQVILTLAQALGIVSEYDENAPEFSSAIVLEMWQSATGIEIKVIMKNGIRHRFRKVSTKQKNVFDRQVNPFIDNNQEIQWDESLTEIYSIDQYREDLQEPF